MYHTVVLWDIWVVASFYFLACGAIIDILMYVLVSIYSAFGEMYITTTFSHSHIVYGRFQGQS